MVTCDVTHGSASLNHGRCFTTGVSQDTVPTSTSRATTVAATDFDSDAIWNTVSASTGSGAPALRMPKPLA